MRFILAILAIALIGSVWADDPVARRPASPGIHQPEIAGNPTDPSPTSAVRHGLIQGRANAATCDDNVTGATAIAVTCFAVAITHIPAGGVAGLILGASGGHFLLAPLVCTPESNP
jgi:hypothetical protein